MADNWQPFPLPDGSYSDDTRPWSAQDLVNYLPVNAEQGGTLSTHKLRTAPGMKRFAYLGTKPVRGMHDVEGRLYAVAGNSLYRLYPDGTQTDLGPIPGTGRVQMVHNQVAGGNQLFIATGTNAYVYADEGAEAASGNPGGSPGGSPGGDPGPEGPTTGGSEGGTAANGGPLSTALGPNGGYPDDGVYPIPLPTVFDTDVIGDGGFSDPGDLDNWKTISGGTLGSEWSLVDDKLHFNDWTKGAAYGYGYRLSLPYMPLPRYDITVTATVNADAGVQVRVGLAWGFGQPNYIEASAPAEYVVADTVSHTWRYVVGRANGGPGFAGRYSIANFVPIVQFIPSGGAAEGDADDVTMVIEEVPTPATVEVIDHLDFDTGLDDWVRMPNLPGNPYTPTVAVAGGEASASFTSQYGDYCWLICETPITTADVAGKYVRITGEVWCNDPTMLGQAGNKYPGGGVALGLAAKLPGSGYSSDCAIAQRGDWTEREAWMPVELDESAAPGVTYHVAIMMQAYPGYTCKVRNLAVEVTDAAVT